jgi:capsular polysaccharide biosynthesis protein
MTHQTTDRTAAWSPGGSGSTLRTVVLSVIVILIVAVATMAAYIYADGQQKVYGGQFQVVYQNGQATSADQIQLDMQTQKALVGSAATLQPVADEFRMPLDTLSKHVSASVDGISNVMTVTASDPDSTRAVDIAKAVADSYMQKASSQSSTQTVQARALLQRRVQRLTDQLRRLQEASSATTIVPGSPEQSQLLAQTQAVLGRISALEDQLTQLDIEKATGPRSQVITPAHLLADPLEPQPLRTAAAAAIAGLVLAGLVVLVAARPRRET